jgi:GNAT superfamily N-acetyltransferase
MRVRCLTLAQRPALRPHFARLHGQAWPAFLRDDPVNALWPELYRSFPEFQLALLDARGRVVAIGNTIPFVWNGRPSGLPDSILDLLRRGLADRRRSRQPTALSALAAIVDTRARGQGLSTAVIRAMARLARGDGLASLVAPVRPSDKGRYPLTPMARYTRWTRPDGALLDPWLRVHQRLGARLLRIIPRGNTVRATVAQWEARTGLRFPESGRYVVPGAFQPIRVDRERDRVRYHEANVWMLHSIPRRAAATITPRTLGHDRPPQA